MMPEQWRISEVAADDDTLKAKLIPLAEAHHYEIEITPVSTAQAHRGAVVIALEEIDGDGRQEMRLRARVR